MTIYKEWPCQNIASVMWGYSYRLPFKILWEETVAGWVIRKVALSATGRRGFVVTKPTSPHLKAVRRHYSETPPWQVEFAVYNGFCYNFRFGAFDIQSQLKCPNLSWKTAKNFRYRRRRKSFNFKRAIFRE